MPVFWQNLPREKNDHLGADPFRVEEGQDLSSLVFQIVQAEVGDADVLFFWFGKNNSGSIQIRKGPLLCFVSLFSRQHAAPDQLEKIWRKARSL
jgi:hypothetical protein